MTRFVKLCVVTALVSVAVAGSRAQGTPAVFINELHYDNTGADAGEFIEIAGPAGTNLADYSIVLYNGSGGAAYDTDVLSGTLPDQQGGFGTAAFLYPTSIQNGSPDGIALVYQGTTVVQFLSYEGVFTATSGAAIGMLSTDIGVIEGGSDPVGESLRLTGTGTGYSDFTWQPSAAASPGDVNAGQTFSGSSPAATLFLDDAYVTEGNSGPATATFTLTVTGAHSGISFDIATSDGTGISRATLFDNDYVATALSGQTIASTDTTYTFDVIVNGDTQFEAEEEFLVSITNVSGATVLRGLGIGVISNDDAPPPDTTEVVISQVYGGGGNAGATYTHDFIELFNPSTESVDLSDWSVQYLSAGGTGTWQVTPLSGSIAAGGYYLIQQSAGTGGTTALPTPDATGSVAMAAGAGKVALRLADIVPFEGACPALGDAADLVGYGGATCYEGSAPSSALSNTLAAFRKRGGCFDSDDNSVDFSSNAPSPRNSASPARSCTFTSTTIHEIQGDGAVTPLLGQDVAAIGIVTALKSNGFFMQTEEDDDLNPATSQGLFVFTSHPPAVAVGDSVEAKGTASEFFNLTQLESSLPGDVTVESTGNAVPPAVTLTTALLNAAGGADQLEPFEGMRMQAGTLVAVAPTNDFGEISAVLPGVPRPMREPGIEQSATVPPDPSSLAVDCCIPRWDENRERILVDSDGLAGATALNVTTGVMLSAVTGPLDFSFSNYKVLPETAPSATANISAVPAPVPSANEFTVAGFNIENFQNGDTQRRKAALAIRQVLHYPDVLGHVEILDLASLQALAAQVNADAVAAGDPDPGYEAHLVPASPGATQNVGFLVKTSRVLVDSVTQEAAGETYINPLNGNPETLHDRPPLVLRATAVLPGVAPRPVIVVVNHLRSFIDIELVGGDGLRVRAKRTAQAESTANLLQTLQFTNPGVPVISIGDYNAYEFNDGYTDPISVITGAPTPDDQVVVDESPDLVNPDFVNLTNSLPAGERYTFVFEGTPQALDHVLVNTVAASLVSRYAVARNNADFPEGALFAGDVTRPERSSDHDMPVAYFVFQTGADLSVTAEGPALPVTTGGAFSYTVTVSNGGPDPATGVTLSIPAQAGFRFSAVTAPSGWACTTPAPGTTGALSCAAASVAAGVAEAFVVTAFVDCGVGDGAFMTQPVSVTGAETDASPADNVAQLTVMAANPPPAITGVVTPITVSPIPGAASAGAVVSNAVLGTPGAIDNCGGTTLMRTGVPAANLFPVGTTTVTYTAIDSGGNTATATAEVKVLNAVESLQALAVDLQAVIAGSTKQALTKRAQDALRAVQKAIAQLQEVPPDSGRALIYVTAAIGDLEQILKKNLLPATQVRDLLKRLTGVSWLLAKQNLELAIANEGWNLNNLIASRLLSQANSAASAGRYSLASTLYWLVVGFTEAGSKDPLFSQRTRSRKARARCETMAFSTSVDSAVVFPNGGYQKIGS